MAHPDWYLDRLKAPHGGQIRSAGAFHLELVVTEEDIRVYITDHFGNPFPTKNTVGAAVVLSGNETIKVKLEPGGDNMLRGSGAFQLDPSLRVGVMLQPKLYEPAAARFVPIKAKTASEDLAPKQIVPLARELTPEPN